MRYQRTSKRRAVILMVVLSLLTLFAIVGVTFVLYADAEAAAARVAREAETLQTADVNPEVALSYFLNQLIYDVPDTLGGVASSLRGHSLARTMYGLNYTVPPGSSLNLIPFNGVGRLHYASGSALAYPGGLTNVPNNFAGVMDDYALVNYSWFSAGPTGPLVRDPERYGARTYAQLTTNAQPNAYVGGNAPYTYPDLNSFFLAAMRADGTVLTPSYHRPWLFQVGGGKSYVFNDMTNPNWTNIVGKYLTLRPRPAEHPGFPLPGDPTGDVKNLPWAPGGNDSIWVDLGAPVMTAPDGTKYKMMFAPLIVDLDGRVNLNTAGNLQAYVAAMAASSVAGVTSNALAWKAASGAHVSNQGWGPWEVNLSKALWGDQAVYPYPQTTPPTPPEWMRLFTGMTYATTTAPNTLPFIAQPGMIPPWPMPGGGLSAWLLPGVRGRYLETTIPPAPPAPLNGTPLFAGSTAQVTPNAAGLVYLNGAPGVGGTYAHAYFQADFNALNEAANGVPSSRPLLPGTAPNGPTNPFAMFAQGYGNGTAFEGTNHPLLYNAFQSPLFTSLASRAFRASDMEALLRPSVSVNGPVNANASGENSDLMRLCPANFPGGSILAALPNNLKALALRYRNLVTTQSTDLGSPGVTPYWWNGMDPTAYAAYWPKDVLNINWPPIPSTQVAPYAKQAAQLAAAALAFPPLPPTPTTSTLPSEFGPDWRSLAASSATYFASTNAYPPMPPGSTGYVTPGARIRLNRPLPPYPHMGALLTPPYNSLPPTTAAPYGMAYDLSKPGIGPQFTAAQNARQALANDIYRRLLAITGPVGVLNNPANPAQVSNPATLQQQQDLKNLAARRWLAQLAVNIVDYIDEDDVMTPFNFYTIGDGLAAASLGQTQGGDDPGSPNPVANNYLGTNATGANPAYWVFGTELPKVVLNEVLAEAFNPDPQNPVTSDQVKVWVELMNTMPAAGTGGANIQPQDGYRVPLYINPNGVTVAKGYSPYRVSIAEFTMERANPPVNAGVANPPFAPGAPNANSGPSGLPDDGSNVLGKAYPGTPGPPPNPAPWTLCPQSTTDADFSPTTWPNGIPLMDGVNFQKVYPTTTVNAGVDVPNGTPGASPYFLIGPKTTTATVNPNGNGNINVTYPDPFVVAGANPGVPATTPVLRTDSMVYTPSWNNPNSYDERTNGVTVMLRRLANPYLPPQPNPAAANYNPYVTVDYIPSVPLQTAGATNLASYGKRQPYAGLYLPGTPTRTTIKLSNSATVANYTYTPNPASPVAQQAGGGAYQVQVSNATPFNANSQATVQSTFGVLIGNSPLPQSGHYDWLVHLDRTPISPMELLHVSGFAPYRLTQQFMLGDDTKPTNPALNTINTFAHYVPWFDGPPYAYSGLPGANPLPLSTMACPWWFDPTVQGGPNYLAPPPSSHRLYRLFEFLECGDRALGVNGLGRIPGKVNINTVWDPEILQALIDANTSMGNITAVATPPLAYSPINPATGLPWNAGNAAISADLVSQIFNNMLLSRSPAYSTLGTYANPNPWLNIGPVNMGTGLDDHPFMPLSTGQYLPTSAGGGFQFPNGLSVTTDTILRTNNPFGKAGSYPMPAAPGPAANTWLLFQNYNDVAGGGLTTSAVHPYYQTQLLTKLYNNITTRSNTFAVFLTVGFFQVMTDPVTGAILPAGGQVNIPQLGPEIGRSEGKQIRHRMFAIIDRTNLTTFTTTGKAVLPATMVTGPTSVPLNLTGLQTIQIPFTPPANGSVTGTATQLFVANPLTGFPGVIQAGTQLVIDPGNINEETVTVISVTPPAGAGTPAHFTANFTLPHGPANTPFTIIQRGNPGPWVLTPYDPRLDTSVVQYFSIID